ncbi:tol-pal system protein YbgF [Solidesulfovibrio fructosivorans JJ]]|uniref:Tol-pal system protein YbgF n=1 Tax=Solidesulfovibrio fructosivorans JJ] TaxID=596151 RepID=E1JZI2_SOLFR|nr:tol-pal system protein YbgF [Solidesulfovibrio fructosivorans]EFL50229.1 tol-pal system protein YbgF [Solidesulfovibrio fructosivorans JJ]]
MSGKRLVTTASAICLSCLLGACGPGNTLPVGKGSDAFRLKAVESSLEKAEATLKELETRQTKNDGQLAALEKRVGEIQAALHAQGVKTPEAAIPQGSALGMGFVNPGAAPESPQPGEKAGVPATPPAPGPSARSERPQTLGGEGIPMPPLGSVPPSKIQSTPRPATPPKGRRGYGRVGQPEIPTTPEAAIAADKAATAATPPVTPPLPVTPAEKRPAAATAQPPQTPPVAGPAATPAAPPATATAAPAPTEPAAPPVSPVPAATPEPSPKPVPAGGGSGPGGYAETASPAEKAAYNRALQLAINGNAGAAKAAFEQFLAANPKSPLAPNALYWVGEGAFSSGDYKTAIGDFEKVAKGWPGHSKAADALYKMAMAQEKTGDTAEARASYERYLKDYPNAELAGLVRQKLQTLPK